jgi:putative ABC transport system permease protein
VQSLQKSPLAVAVQIAEPGDAAQRVSNLSRAYRVNLTVLALVALFTGAFLVFSVLALSVAKRRAAVRAARGAADSRRTAVAAGAGRIARARLVGSIVGIALGTALAAFALKVLGATWAAATSPAWRLRCTGARRRVVVRRARRAGGDGRRLVPARAAQALPEAQTLKGLGPPHGLRRHGSASCVLGGALMAFAPAVYGMPHCGLSVRRVAAGGRHHRLAGLIALLYDRLAPLCRKRLLPLLAVERARRMRGTAAVAVSGVVASLSLAVALTVMVASFRDSVTRWLDVVLPPTSTFVRPRGFGGECQRHGRFRARPGASHRACPGVTRVSTRARARRFADADAAAVTLLARSFVGDARRRLPLVGDACQAREGRSASM